jgi:radical SAM protein with 4Fe4S-binding SPASM domain
MSAQYKLKEPFALRGWDGMPYVITDQEGGRAKSLNKHVYDVLSFCDGTVDFDRFLIPDEFRKTAGKLLEEGIIEPCGQGCKIKPYQKYKCYPNKYIRTAHWSITGRCNYKCRHCYMSAPDAKYGELSRERCLDIIDQLHDCGVMNVSITGGEALVRSDFLELLDRMLAYGIHVTTIYSNGKLVTPKLLDALERRRIYPEFNLSFDGCGWHDWLRGVQGAEETAINAFRLCHERGFPTGAEMCLHQRNKHTLRESINLLASLGVEHLKTNPVSKSGAWIENAGDDTLDIQELFEVYLDYIPHFFEDGEPMQLQLGGFFMTDEKGKYILPSVKTRGGEDAGKLCVCGHARNVMYISADGRILPCMSLSGLDVQEQFPLVTETSLKDCLTDSFYMRLIETTVDEYLARNARCADCEWKYFCAAGCRASALESAGDLMGSDEAVCTFFKGGYISRVMEAAKGYECVNYKQLN